MLWADYCLTTISPDSRNPENFILFGMRPWRSWIARQTPTLKAAGSNPVGRTKKQAHFRCRKRKAYGISGFRVFYTPIFQQW